MLSKLSNYERIIDNSYGVLSAFSKDKDKNQLSVVMAECLTSGSKVVVVVKVMGNLLNEDFIEEVKAN